MNSNDVLGNYKLQNLLGRGQSGEVWSAIGNEVVALKIFDCTDNAKRLAEREFSMATKFNHPNILRPTSVCELSGRTVIVMPLCKGRSVDGVAGFVGEENIWRLILHISSALTEIHQQGYAHCDVKPSNILWTGEKFLLSDFSSCRQIGKDAENLDVADDKSSFRYQAPEAAAHRIAPASDVWSLGASVFHLFMGVPVFCGLGGRAQTSQSPIPYMRKECKALSQLISDCLRYDPAERPTAEHVANLAETQLRKWPNRAAIRPKRATQTAQSAVPTECFWPGEMA